MIGPLTARTVTIGGVNGPICHGAGARHKTVSDYVRAVEYVDATGELQTITDPGHLRAAAGCFGLLGIVTHITFELDKMTYTILKPRKVDVATATPPLNIDEIPRALRDDDWGKPEYLKELEACRTVFEERAANHYYSEWFWFRFQQKVWVNTWENVSDSKTSRTIQTAKVYFSSGCRAGLAASSQTPTSSKSFPEHGKRRFWSPLAWLCSLQAIGRMTRLRSRLS